MSDFNPYAAPQSEVPVWRGPDPIEVGGVYRDGELLVMTKDAVLPDRCLKCNLPANGWRIKRNLSWHPPVYYALIFIAVLLYVIVALIVRNTAKVEIPLCETHRRQRRQAIIVGWLAVLFGIVLIFVGASGEQPVATLLGVVLLLFGIFYGVFRSRVEYISKIDKQWVWLKKVSPEFLAELPPWNF